MSVNYNNKDGTISTLAAGSRVWIGTSSAFETSKNNIPNNTTIYITDDTVEDTGWLNGTNCRARQIGNVVYVEVSNTNSLELTSTALVIATLPSQISITREISGLFLTDNSNDIPLNARIKTNGEIVVWKNGNVTGTEQTGAIYGTISFLID